MRHGDLRIADLTRRFGGLTAVDRVSFHLPPGGIVGLIGPNGAGKTTLLSVLGGQLQPQSGTIHLDGQRIDGLSADRLHALGLVRSFQIPRPFRRLTVLENLLLACPQQPGESLVTALFRPARIAAAERAATERARTLLDDLRLDGHRDSPAGALSGGQHKLLEMARALMAEPRVMLLDEPCAGVNPALMSFLSETIERLRGLGLGFVIVEHDFSFVARHCDVAVVLVRGSVLAQGTPEEMRHDPRVREAFLGEPHG